MKMLLTATALAASLCAPQAFAQINQFGGFSLGLNANIASASNKFTANNTAFRNGDSSQALNLQAGYGFVGGDNFVFGLGLVYGPGDIRMGSATTGGITYELKGKDLYALYFEPGFLVSSGTLAYFKVSYQGMRGETSLSTGVTSKDDYIGTGYGAGIRTMLAPNLYLQAEVEQVEYNEKSAVGMTSKPTSTLGTIGLGYHF